MKICPNLSDPAVKKKWDAIVNSSEVKALATDGNSKLEAMREFMEAEIDGRQIGTPEQVAAKLERRLENRLEEDAIAQENTDNILIAQKSGDPTFIDRNTLMGQAILTNPINTDKLNRDDNDKTRAMEIARKLSEQLGIPFQIVSAEDAVRITDRARNPINTAIQKAFFYDGTVYMIADRLTTEIAFHEFIHPLVKALNIASLEQKATGSKAATVFDTLINKALAADPTLEDQALKEYAGLRQAIQIEIDPAVRESLMTKYKNAIQEEILVKAMTKAAMLKLQNAEPTTAFGRFIRDFMYAIKQLLRKVFGRKVDLNNLDVDTSIDELAEMLVKGQQFEINTNLVSDKDVVNYNTEFTELVKELEEITQQGANLDMVNLARKIYDGTSQHIELLIKNKNYAALLELFVDEYNRGDLQEMRSNIAKYARQIVDKAQQFVQDVETVQNQSQALVSSMLRLELMMKKMEDHLKKIKSEPQDQDYVHKAYYYDHVISYWQKYVQEAKATMLKSGANARSPLIALLNSINTSIETSNSYLNELAHAGVGEELWKIWEDMSIAAEDTFTNNIANMRRKGATPKVIENAFIEFYGMPEEGMLKLKAYQNRLDAGEQLSYSEQQEYNNLIGLANNGLHMTKQKIEAALRGEGPDAKLAGSYGEGYLYNQDPVIGGFAVFLRDNLAEMETRAQAKMNEALEELTPALKEAGVSFNIIGDLGKKIGFVDNIGYFDKEKKEFIKKEVWTLLNPYKDYRFDIDKFNHEIRELQNAYNHSGSEKDRDILLAKVAEKNKHLRKWFHQRYTDEYYAADDLLEKDAVGIQAAYLRDSIFEKMKDAKRGAQDEYELLKLDEEMQQYWNQYRLLFSRYYPNGKLKRNYYIDNNNVEREITDLDRVEEYKNLGYKVVIDLAVADRLQEHRKLTRKFHEFKLRPGAFENALKNFEQETRQKLIRLGYKPDSLDASEREEYDDYFEYLRGQWLKKNTRTVIKPEFYEKRADILRKIKEITQRPLAKVQAKIDSAKTPAEKAKYEQIQRDLQDKLKKIDFSDSWAKIIDVTAGYRDDDNQPVGSNVPDGRRELIKDAQQAMEDAKAEWAGMSGLTREEMDTLIGYAVAKASGQKLSKAEYNEFKNLLDKQKVVGLDEYERMDLNGLFADLKALQKKEPTDYYLDVINHYLDMVGDNDIYTALGAKEVDQGNIDNLSTEVLDMMFDKSPEFKEWFEKNHTSKTVYDREKEDNVTVYDRLYIWNVVKPVDPDMYESTTIKDENGEDVPIPGLPALKYYSRVVKKQYRTGYDPATGEVKPIVGLHIDNTNRDDNWLPKEIAGSPYLNDRYFEMKNAPAGSQDAKMFKVLEIIKKYHLKNQEGSSRRAKLYLDFPRFEMEGLELLQTRGIKGAKEKVSLLGSIFKKIANFFKGSKADSGTEFNWELQKQLVRADAFDDQIENMPIQGLFNLELKEVSTDIITSMFRYMYGLEHHKQLSKMNPLAQGIKRILNDPNAHIKEPDKVNLQNFTNFGLTTYVNKKGKYVRRDAFNNYYEREFEGKSVTGFGKDWKGLQNVQRFLFGKASFSFFAFNIPSALKNMFGAKFQSMIHAAGGTDIKARSLVKGDAWSLKYMTKLSFGDAYAKGKKSLEHQIGEIFNPLQNLEEKFGRSISRTGLKDAVSLEWTTNFRKWTEMQAGMQTFGGMMYKKKVKMGDNEIDYMDAWELVNGNVQLKKGIDVRYAQSPTKYTVQEGETMADVAAKLFMTEADLARNIRGQKFEAGKELTINNSEFKLFRGKIQAVMRKLNGAYAKRDQPELQRYIAFRFVSYLRRYFTTMAINRFGTKRWNPGYSDIDEGYYITAVKAFLKLIKYRNTADMTPEDKAAFMKVATEIGTILIMSALIGMLWGWDDGDEERYEKLRARSGFASLAGLTRERDYDEQFDFGGWVSLHIMNLVMQVKAENEQFIPSLKGVKNLTGMLDLKSIAFGPTTDTYQEILGDVQALWDDSDRAFYKRRVGPYKWQDQEGVKLWAHLAKMFGFTGSTIDPAQGITNFQKAQNLSSIK